MDVISDWHTLDIYTDYKQFNKFINNTSFIPKLDLIKKYLIPLSLYIVQNGFKVREIPNIDSKNNSCDIKEEYFDEDGLKKDYYLFIFVDNKPNENYLGFANSCKNHSRTNRPIIGFVNINLAFITLNESKYYEYFLTIIHEIFHTLGFTGNSISLFIDQNFNNIALNNLSFNDKNWFYIKSKNLINISQKHFQCNNIKGLKFENVGGRGSANHHWEKTELGNDFMIAADALGLKISDFTFGFLQDSGWYQVDYRFSQKLGFGTNKGCDFINKCNPKFNEFCDSGERCSNDFLHPTKCDSNKFTGDCKYSHNIRGYCNIKSYDNNTGDYFGYDSRCLIKNDSGLKSNCYKSKCTNNGKEIIFESSNKIVIICKKEGNTIIEGIIFVCPKIDHFCDMRYECKNSCTSNGICYNGNCICFKGFIGIACEFSYPHKQDISCTNNCYNNGYCKRGKCICYDNYEGSNCENIINDVGSFGSNCKNSAYVKCYFKFDDSFLNLSYISLLRSSLLILFLNN